MHKGTAEKPSLVKRALLAIDLLEEEIQELKTAACAPIAIIGAGCRLPGGVDTPAAFWELLINRRDAVTEILDARWDSRHVYDPDPAAVGKMYNTKAGFIRDVDKFDGDFFNISPLEAIMMDPQQRLALETAWHALEDAGIAPDSLMDSSTGVFMGLGQNDYAFLTTRLAGMYNINAYYGLGNGHCFTPGRISHLLGLHGPCLALDTACSSSLLAIHMACQSLRQGECTLALAGGVQLMLSPLMSIYLSRTGALSASGHCRAFSADADGFVRAEGTGVVVLKKLQDALDQGDQIMAVIKGSAANHDGKSSGITVPNGLAQEALLRTALSVANVDPEQVAFIEAHGTGTPLGDPIELDALQAVFGRGPGDEPLWVGAAKSNVGHLEAAAGVTGLIKAAMALQHRTLPASLHFRSPNPQFEWSASALRVPVTNMPLTAGERPLAAGVSAFGLSGTNVHLVLEEAPVLPAVEPLQLPLQLLTLSAKEPATLLLQIRALREHCESYSGLRLEDIAFTANTGRQHFLHRTVLIVPDRQALLEQLSALTTDSAVKAHNGQFHNEGMPHGEITFSSWAEKDTVKVRQEAVALAAAYLRGEPVAWQALYAGCQYRKVSLPLTTFNRKRYWLDMLPEFKGKKADFLNNIGEAPEERMEQYLFDYTWIKENSLPVLQEPHLPAARRIIFLCCEADRARWQQLLPADHQTIFMPADPAQWTQPAANITDGAELIYAAAGVTVPGVSAAAAALQHIDHLRLLVQACTAKQVTLSVITSGAFPVTAADPLQEQGWQQAGITGFCKCLALEYDGLLKGVLDLPPALPDTEWQAVMARFLSLSGEPLRAYREGCFWVPRLQAPMPSPSLSPFLLDAAGVYLVTGGTGYLGLKAVKWLADHGAQKIFICSRSGSWTKEGRFLADSLQQQVPLLRVVRTDLSREEEVQALCREIKEAAGCTRISGVIHAAGSTDVCGIRELSAASLEEITAPKIAGTWWLYKELQAAPPDFFIAFSSIAAAWGSRGQAHYAAANLAMDALLQYWRQQGCKAFSIQWGPWFGGGMTSAADAALLESIGIVSFPAWQNLHVLDTLLAHTCHQPIIVNALWPRLQALFATHHKAGLFDLLVPAATAAPAPGVDRNLFLTALQQMPAGEAHNALQQMLREEVARVLVYQDGKLPELQKGFFDLGLDSLAAIQLLDHVKTRLQISLKVAAIFEHNTIKKLSAYLLQQVRLHVPAAATTAAAAPAPYPVWPAEEQEHPADRLIAQLASAIQLLEQQAN